MLINKTPMLVPGRVSLEDKSESLSVIVLVGSRSASVLEEIISGSKLPSKDQCLPLLQQSPPLIVAHGTGLALPGKKGRGGVVVVVVIDK